MTPLIIDGLIANNNNNYISAQQPFYMVSTRYIIAVVIRSDILIFVMMNMHCM